MADPINCSNTTLPTSIDFTIDVRKGSLVSLVDLSIPVFATPEEPTAGQLPWDSRRVQFYESFGQVTAVYGEDSESAKAASAFFGQDPRPARLAIGEVYTAPLAGSLQTLPVPQDNIDALILVDDGEFDVTFGTSATDTQVVSLTGLDFTAATDPDSVALVITTALDAEVTGATCLATTNLFTNITYFTFNNPLLGNGSTVSTLRSPATSAGTDISGEDYLNGQNGVVLNGYTPTGLVTELQLILDAASCQGKPIKRWVIDAVYRDTTDQRAVAAFTENQQGAHFFAASADPNNKSWPEDTTNAYYFFKMGYKNTYIEVVDPLTVAQYNEMAMASIMLATNYNESNSIVNAKFRVYNGINPTAVQDESQLAAILNKRANVFTNVGNIVSCTRDGTTSSPLWYLDDKLGVDNYINELISGLYLTFTRNNRIPYTQQGLTQLNHVFSALGNKYDRAGLLDDRIVISANSGSGTRTLPAYSVTFEPLSAVSMVDRDNRVLPGTVITLQLAGAINQLNIRINVDG